MTVLGPDFIALQVRDLPAAAAFYDRLGLLRDPSGPPHAVVYATSPAFALREPLPGLELDACTPRPGAGVALWLRADDAQAVHDDLVSTGVEILAPPTDGPFGRQFTLADPEGYAITIHDQA